MRYSGEQYDSDLNQQYLRGRYYNQNNGQFNRLDPYSGNKQDPQSYNKYGYCHDDPVNAIDPTGMFSLGRIMIASAIMGILSGIATYAYTGSVKKAVFVGILFALLTAGIMALITFWPQIVRAAKSSLNYQKAHRTVTNRLFKKMFKECGDDLILRNQFYSNVNPLRMWLYEFPVGWAQQLLTIFTDPSAFITWFTPTPAGAVGVVSLGSLGGAALWLYWDEAKNYAGSFLRGLEAYYEQKWGD